MKFRTLSSKGQTEFHIPVKYKLCSIAIQLLYLPLCKVTYPTDSGLSIAPLAFRHGAMRLHTLTLSHHQQGGKPT